jgi:hypothetical protein
MATTTAQPGPELNEITVQDAKITGQTKTSFGFSSLLAPTPKEATLALGAYLIIAPAFISWISTTKLISPDTILEIKNFVLIFLTPVSVGLSQMFGVKAVHKKPSNNS